MGLPFGVQVYHVHGQKSISLCQGEQVRDSLNQMA